MNTNEIQKSSIFERFLFGFTRVFALGGSLFAILIVISLLVRLIGSNNKDNFVSLSDLKPSLQSEHGDVIPQKVEVKLTENIKKYFSDEKNKMILYGWIESLDENKQKDFIKNLSSIILEAEKKNENVIDVINEYKILKLKKLQESEFDQYKTVVEKSVVIGAIFGLFIFIALMSLILVMLTIERNTRKNN